MPAMTATARDDRTPRLGPTLDFLRLLWSIENGLQRASKRMAASLGITGPQRLALLLISRYPGISANEVADYLRLHPSTITGVRQRLVDKGLLSRERDGRRVHLRATPAAAKFTRRSKGTAVVRLDESVAHRLPTRLQRFAKTFPGREPSGLRRGAFGIKMGTRRNLSVCGSTYRSACSSPCRRPRPCRRT